MSSTPADASAPRPRRNDSQRPATPAGGTPALPAGGAPALPPGLDRRGFLRSTAGGSAALALAALLPGCGREADAQGARGEALRSLTAKEFQVARAAAEALLPEAGVDPADIAMRIDYELWAVGGGIEEDMRTVLQLLEHLTLLGGRLRRFTELNPEERLAYLETWQHSRFNLRRAAFNAIRSFVYFFAYSDPEMWPATGFPGTWPGRVPVGIPPVDFGEVA